MPREESLETVTRAFELYGYQVCNSEALEPGFEKVALYVDADGSPTHAARQTSSGIWSSKLGNEEDIEHHTLDALDGELYGQVARLLKRPARSSHEG